MPQKGQSAKRKENRAQSWLRGQERKAANRKANDARHAANVARGVELTGHEVVVTAREAKRAKRHEQPSASLLSA